MATLLNEQTTDTDGSSTGTEFTAETTVWVTGELGGATVIIQGAPAATAADFGRMDQSIIRSDTFRGKGSTRIAATGTYYLRAELSGATATTSVTVTTTE